MDVVTFDIETRHLITNNRKIRDLGIACIALKEINGPIYFYEQDDVGEFVKRVHKADLVCGFNSISFDYEVVAGTLGVDTKVLVENTNNFDILFEIKRILKNKYAKGWKLDNISKATLGVSKTDSGLEAPRMFKENKIFKLLSYCANDVIITENLVKFINDNGFMLNNDASPNIFNLSYFKGVLNNGVNKLH